MTQELHGIQNNVQYTAYAMQSAQSIKKAAYSQISETNNKKGNNFPKELIGLEAELEELGVPDYIIAQGGNEVINHFIDNDMFDAREKELYNKGVPINLILEDNKIEIIKYLKNNIN